MLPDPTTDARPAHRAPRRPTVSWPAALLPAALLLTLLSVGTVGSTASDVPVTDLHVVVGPGDARD